MNNHEANELAMKMIRNVNGEYYPWSPSNLSDALGDISPKELTRISEMLMSGESMNAGAEILDIVYARYWKWAKREAESILYEKDQTEVEDRLSGRGTR